MGLRLIGEGSLGVARVAHLSILPAKYQRNGGDFTLVAFGE